MALHYPKNNISFFNLHAITKRATPEMIVNYRVALQLKNPLFTKIQFMKISS
jgi:hypothetical protein